MIIKKECKFWLVILLHRNMFVVSRPSNMWVATNVQKKHLKKTAQILSVTLNIFASLRFWAYHLEWTLVNLPKYIFSFWSNIQMHKSPSTISANWSSPVRVVHTARWEFSVCWPDPHFLRAVLHFVCSGHSFAAECQWLLAARDPPKKRTQQILESMEEPIFCLFW